MLALQINVESYYEVPTVELLSVGNAPANSQDLKGEKSSRNHLGQVTHLHSRGKFGSERSSNVPELTERVSDTFSLLQQPFR